MKRIILTITAIIFITLLSCNEGITNPEPDYPPGRRDYTWKADTIEAYFTFYTTVWGDSITDVWTVSSGGSPHIIRYDGSKWKPEEPAPTSGPRSVFGVNGKVWICADEGKIFKYENGVFEKQLDLHPNTSLVSTGFIDIYGKDDNTLYAIGGWGDEIDGKIDDPVDGLIYKYDGTNWQLDKKLNNSGWLNRVRYSMRNDRYYFSSYVRHGAGRDTIWLQEYDGNNLKTIFREKSTGDNDCLMNDIDGYMYITIGKKFYRYINNEYQFIFEVDNPNFGGQFYGRNKNDIVIRMFNGLAHYNGTDVEYILETPENLFICLSKIFENNIILVTYDNNTGFPIIFHGTLNKE